MLLYHFSLKRFDKLSDLGTGSISLLLDKPTENAIERLRYNGFSLWGKLRQPYSIYTIDLEPYQDDIYRYTITSIPDEWAYREQNDNDWTEEDKINYLLFKGIRVRFDSYNKFVKGVKSKWCKFNHYAIQQINLCKELGKYFNLYAAFIPHVMIECKKNIEIEPVEIIRMR